MLKVRSAALLGAIVALIVYCNNPALALQAYMDAYNASQYKTSAWVNRCDLCHISPGGGGARNSFGTYYETHGHSFSSAIRAAFPSRFANPANFISNVKWSTVAHDLTPTTTGSIDISLSAVPTNAGSSMSYKVTATKAVQKYINLSTTSGSIACASMMNIGTDTITVSPRAILSTAKMQAQLAKAPLSLILTLTPLNNDGSLATTQKTTVTIKVHL